jgi:hypothetical protein
MNRSLMNHSQSLERQSRLVSGHNLVIPAHAGEVKVLAFDGIKVSVDRHHHEKFIAMGKKSFQVEQVGSSRTLRNSKVNNL